MSIDANRGYVCLDRHQPHGLYGVYADTTAAWYFLRYEATAPAWAFADDPDFEREVGDLYRRDRMGEPLGGVSA